MLGGGLADVEAIKGGGLLGLSLFEVFWGVFFEVIDECA